MGDLRSFLQRAKQPRYTIPERVRTHPTEASAVPPDTTLSPRPFPSGPTALGLRSFPPRPTRPPASTGKSASTGESAGQEHRSPGKSASTGKSTSPGKSVGQEHRSPGKSTSTGNPPARNIVRPENPPARLTFHQSTAGPSFIPPGTRPVRLFPAPLSFTGTFHIPFPSPQHAPRIAPPAEWHASRAAPEPPPYKSAGRTGSPTKRAAARRGRRSPTIGFGSDYLLLSWL